jgi:ABC-type glycerol-3-phosphate transport system permease component
MDKAAQAFAAHHPAGRYTAFAAGPFVWVAIMSLRTTSEIMADHFALPAILHWEKFPIAWFNSNYNVYFKNSAMIVLAAVAILDDRRRDGGALPRRAIASGSIA